MLIEMTVKGVILDPTTNTPVVLLRDLADVRILPIWIGGAEANAIATQMENLAPARPMTHDLLRLVIDSLRARVSRIVVSDLKDATFYAVIHLEVADGDAVTVDSRPSDAIALALRTKAPIFVEESVIDHAKTTDLANERMESDRLQKWLEGLDPDDLGKYKM
jgi:bifunctional DNase/RNase